MTTITKRLLTLQGVLLFGLGTLFILPKYHGVQPLGIELSLPPDIGMWHGIDAPVSEKERQVLGKDTEFARKIYTTANGGGIYVSIVLSGQDVNTSLHQPDRCLPAQGWNVMDRSTETMHLDNGSSIQATRLHNKGNGGFSIYYYWFVGCTDVVASPTQRSLIDWRDRIFHGYNQRWAYITVASSLKNDDPETRAAADEAVKNFVAELFPKIWKPSPPKG